MTYQAAQRPTSRMVASPQDPWVAVSLISEHVYCPRAAIILHEKNQEDTGDEEQPIISSKRHISVFYTIAQIERELQRLSRIRATVGVTTLILLAVTLASMAIANLLPFFGAIGGIISMLAGLGFVGCAIGTVSVMAQHASLYHGQYLPAINTPPREPPPTHTESQPVEWWGLINAGFQVVRPQEQYRDPHWHLAGCPWRVLVRGNLRIPVFRARSRRNGEDRLFRKHLARMAAYSHLIEKNERAQSPYGVVLFGSTLKGMTVPNAPGIRSVFHDGLVSTRRTIAALAGNGVPGEPPEHICKNCPLSRRDRATGLSECGTRFRWTPPNFRDDYTY